MISCRACEVGLATEHQATAGMWGGIELGRIDTNGDLDLNGPVLLSVISPLVLCIPCQRRFIESIVACVRNFGLGSQIVNSGDIP